MIKIIPIKRYLRLIIENNDSKASKTSRIKYKFKDRFMNENEDAFLKDSFIK